MKIWTLIIFCGLTVSIRAMNGQTVVFGAGPAENVGLHLDSKVLTSAPTMGKPILVEVTVANQTGKVYTWWVTTPEPEYRNFNFTLLDDQNVEVKRTTFHRHLRGEWRSGDESSDDVALENKIPITLAPGKRVVYQVNLSRIFQIGHAGVYTLSMSTKERVSEVKKLTIYVATRP